MELKIVVKILYPFHFLSTCEIGLKIVSLSLDFSFLGSPQIENGMQQDVVSYTFLDFGDWNKKAKKSNVKEQKDDSEKNQIRRSKDFKRQKQNPKTINKKTKEPLKS